MLIEEKSAQLDLAIDNEKPRQSIYLCFYRLKHGYCEEWLNGYDIIGLPWQSRYLFTAKQLDQLKHSFNFDRERLTKIKTLPLIKARFEAGKQIQHDMK